MIAFASKHRFEVPNWNLKNGTAQHILLSKLNQRVDNLLVIKLTECAVPAASGAPIQMRMGMMM
jgi:hypothetical protein